MSLAERHYGLPKFFGNLAAMNEPAVQLKHLADVVLRRRTWLGLRQDQMKDLGGPSTTTMTKVENASPPAPSADTLRKLDHSLLWEPGSAKTVLYGGEPTSNDSTIPFERRDARLAKAFAAESKIVELLLDLAIEADEVDHSASLLDTNVDDTEGAEQLASDVDSLLIDIDRLTQRIHDEALEAVGGDLVELRARKAKVINERRQRRLGRTQQIELPPPLELADAARQEPDPKEDPS